MNARSHDDDAAADRMVASEYLSAPTAAADLRQSLEVALDPAVTELVRGARRLVLVGSGGSYAALLTARYLLDEITGVPVDVIAGKDLLWRRPGWLGPDTVVLFVSYSGHTTDVVEALEIARVAGCPTVGITGRAGSTLDTDCTHSLVYSGAAIYEVPIALILRLVDETAPLTTALGEVVTSLKSSAETMPDQMREAADRLAGARHVHVIGAGPLSSLAFKLAPVLMENVRISASYFDAAEFRHGSIEFLERDQPTVLALLGTDASRETTAMVINFITARGGTVEVLDAAELGGATPLLTPLVINSWTQWLVAWSAQRRGIADLDERIYMGKGLLSNGQWP